MLQRTTLRDSCIFLWSRSGSGFYALRLTWSALTFTGPACAGSVAALAQSGRLTARRPQAITA
ncbi:hypothetical protein [Streptomyces sp. NPDC058457]|uniref:hypothetical protein n=1 Tax=Streptomyces sp. NPDC058457 TaxID=3346507 RepID=UPI003660F524